MPSLDWIGKSAVINHDQEVPFHLLARQPNLGHGMVDTGNLLVQGDNLVALKALLPRYAGSVKCIYIDPPYNTGAEQWVYNDAVNSSEMQAWLGRVVGQEREDLTRHDKWLCMMYPRMKLLREFLRKDGVLFVSIGEAECGNLRLLLDELFGPRNALGSLVWKRRSSSAMRGMPLSIDHEYVLVYALDAEAATLYGLEKGPEGYPYQDAGGQYTSTDLTVGMTRHERPNQFFPITNPRTGTVYEANPERVWRFYPETMAQVIADGLIIWPDESEGNMTRPRYKTYYRPETAKPKPVASWIESKGRNEREVDQEAEEYDVAILTSGLNQEGARELQQLFGQRAFGYPKPTSLVRSLIRCATRSADLILDSFAGTGTTGHAVLSLNHDDGGQRRFILVEMDERISRDITAERLRRVIDGYSYDNPRGGTVSVEGLDGGFDFFSLGPEVLSEDGSLNPNLTWDDLAAFIFYQDTGRAVPSGPSCDRAPLVGRTEDAAYYLLTDGMIPHRNGRSGTLDEDALCHLGEQGARVVYGERCLLDPARLQRERIVFRQVPYDLPVGR